MDNDPIAITCTINASPDRVWQALTDKEQMKKWYFEIPDFRAEPGFEFQFSGGDGTKTFVHLCRITAVVPQHKLSHTWRYEGERGNSLVSFELFPEGNNTRVKLTHTGLETFPRKPEFAVENFRAGWKSIIENSLKNFVENP